MYRRLPPPPPHRRTAIATTSIASSTPLTAPGVSVNVDGIVAGDRPGLATTLVDRQNTHR